MSKPICIALLLLILVGCSPTVPEEEMETRNKKTVLDYVDTIWNSKNLNKLDTFYADQFLRIVNGIEVATDNADLAANINVLFVAFPDMQLTVDHIAGSEKSVFLNWSIVGTNTGIFGDHLATGKKVQINGVTRLDFNEEGKIFYDNVIYNELSLLQQLGYKLEEPKVE